MTEIISLKEVFKDQKNDFLVLEVLVKAAMLDPDDSVRSLAIEGLRKYGSKESSGIIKSVFNGDNQIFLVMQLPGTSPKTFYLCDIPNEYIFRPTRVYDIIL